MYSILMTFILLAKQVNGQFGDIASFAPNFFGNAAGAATGLLRDIGALYQIAQGALQLTGTGVNILNQASEGKWFNTVVEETKHANREFHEKTLIGNRLEPDYSPFGINFPAPSPSDYDNEDNKKEEILIPFSTITERTASTVSAITNPPIPVTLFPEEKTTNNLNEKENLITVSVTDINENGQEIGHSGKTENLERNGVNEFNSYDNEEKETDKKFKLVDEKVAKLQRFIDLLHKSNITENDLNQLTYLLERGNSIKSKTIKSSTESRIFFNNSFISSEYTNEPGSTFTTDLPMVFRRVKFIDMTDNEDSDLLPSTTTRPRVRAVRIKYQPRDQIRISSTSTSFHSHRKYPRRTAYRAPLTFATSSNHIDARIEKPIESKVNMNGAIPQIPLTEQRSDVTKLQFLQPIIYNPMEQPKVYLTEQAFGIFQTPMLSSSPYSQTINAIGTQPLYTSVLENHNNNINNNINNNNNNGLWPQQAVKFIRTIE